ncbi:MULTISPECIES: hypothetical protein [unclassified Pseudoxanthomonas]|uniref:hypothetical protein n=1 Tax=unclassified Pseudoxanthomonas TaxID=2645906 RepID=UPI003077C7CD
MTPSLPPMLSSVRRRFVADNTAIWFPLVVVGAVLAWGLFGPGPALSVGVAGATALMALSLRRSRRFDNHWIAHALNERRRDLDDSADLLFADGAMPDSLNPLQRLQRERLQQRLAAHPAPDLRARWSWRRIAATWLVSIVASAGILLWPSREAARITSLAPSEETSPVAAGMPRLVGQRLRIIPPAYTRLPARNEDSLGARAPQGSALQWTLRFEPQPASADLVFHDGRRVGLTREGDLWTARDKLDKSTLYRVVPHGTAANAPRLHRLDAVIDRPPQIRILAPDRSLSLVSLGQRAWPLSFEASDDYGVAATASLRITLAQGSGENITFRERTLTVAGRGTATAKRFDISLDLAAQGLAVGDDLVAQLSVSDNRSPYPQSARSSSLILRWPSDLGNESTGLEGMVKKVMPAYFRSQRQIIIDAEALLKEKRKLSAERYLQRSDEIGVDQRLLRLRYGQFLGEEAEGAPKPPPTNDAEETHAGEEHADGAHHEDDGHDRESPTAAPTDDHDHGGAANEPSPGFGREADVLEEFGHTHDHAEAATLLDPETRGILKQALDQMWQSELNLRQGRPDAALPYAYKALEFIKRVQQASRIYLARVGPELPPIDESRRLSGDRAGLARRDLPPTAATDPDKTPAELWLALADAPDLATDRSADLDALEGWLRRNEARVPDPLAFVAAIDAARNDPQCEACRRQLHALLWTVLPRPPAQVPRRAEGDVTGRRYLEALRQESTP